MNELLEQFRSLLTATILDEDEEHVLASCSYDRVRNLLQTRGCSNENRLRLWSLVLGLSSAPDVSILRMSILLSRGRSRNRVSFSVFRRFFVASHYGLRVQRL